MNNSFNNTNNITFNIVANQYSLSNHKKAFYNKVNKNINQLNIRITVITHNKYNKIKISLHNKLNISPAVVKFFINIDSCKNAYK